MNTSESTQTNCINELLTYIEQKEAVKKSEVSKYLKENKEQFTSQREKHCHYKEEKDISNEDDAQRTKRNHYKKIGDNYESLWKFEEQYEPTLYDDINGLLDLQENDIVVDLGGGTGNWSEKLKKGNPTCDLLLSEPCLHMLDEAQQFKDIELFLMDENQFFDSQIYFNKMMLKGCIHHFKDIKGFLDKLYEKLPEGGRALVLTLNDEGYCLPYPQIVHSYLDKLRAEQDFMKQFYEKPWFSKVIHRLYPVSITQDEVKRVVKGRFTSTLSLFTDEQLATGLEEKFKEMDPQQMISFFYSESLLMMEKPFNIQLTEEDMIHMSKNLSQLGLSDDFKIGMQVHELKQKLEKMLLPTS